MSQENSPEDWPNTQNKYEDYENWPTKSERRERKRARTATDSRMRGNRDIFEIQKAIVKRARQTR